MAVCVLEDTANRYQEPHEDMNGYTFKGLSLATKR